MSETTKLQWVPSAKCDFCSRPAIAFCYLCGWNYCAKHGSGISADDFHICHRCEDD